MNEISRLISRSHNAFNERGTLELWWQEIAENFYPRRSDFTGNIPFTANYVDHLTDSFPIIAHRELSDAIGSMLRTGPWFEGYVVGDDGSPLKDQREINVFADHITQVQRTQMTNIATNFDGATKDGDADWCAFGHCVIMPLWNGRANRLLYQNFHPRDCAFEEDWARDIKTVYRKCNMTAEQWVAMMGEKVVHPDVLKMSKDKEKCKSKVKGLHIQIPTDTGGQYLDGPTMNREYQNVYIDVENEHVMEQIGKDWKSYIVPRWKKLPQMAYGISPAIEAALPDARLIQAMTWTLLEAGERIANPTYLVRRNAIRGEMDLIPNGLIAVADDYDSRLGDPLTPITIDRNGLPFAMNMKEDVRAMIQEAMYTATMQLPIDRPQMTAEEVRARMEEFIRRTRPLFDPAEKEYNGELCNISYNILMQQRVFGDPDRFPRGVKGRNFEFQFRSPINEAEERGYGALFQRSVAHVAAAREIDQTAALNFNTDAALRDAISGEGSPERWLTDERDVAKGRQAAMQQMAAEREMELAERAAAAG